MSDNYADFKEIIPEWVNEGNFDDYKLRHTAEHIFSQACVELWPNKVRRALAHLSEKTFANDSEWDSKITEEDFGKIEQKMKEIVNRKLEMKQEVVSEEQAREIFKGNKFKQETIDKLIEEGKELTIYRTGDQFVDLCKGPHVDNTKEVSALKLMSLSGAYWKGDENNEMLTRVYGVAFKSKEDLNKYIWQIEEAKKRDHRKIGKELDLFTFSELVGPGLPMWTPKGTVLRDQLDNYVWELRKAKGYEKVTIPHITKKALYETSGHWEKYANDLYKIQTGDDEQMALKPMNCPHHTQIFAHIPRSYRDMPQRYAETTMVYRAEQSGELAGLSRVISITQDDAHVFLRKNQIREEIEKIWDIVDSLYSTFEMPLKVRLSFRDLDDKSKYLGDDEVWDKAESEMEEIAKARGADYFIGRGEAAFYAPKLDFMALDSLEREHQVATIQLDLNMPVRFGLTCINEEGEKEQIFMLHAAIMGSIERFLSVLIEHLGGLFPAWLAPEQVMVIPISDNQNGYSDKVVEELSELGIRAKADQRSDKMQGKIRDAQNLKIPYMLIVGGREEEENTVSVRYRNEQKNEVMSFEEFKDKLVENIKSRKLEIKL